MKYFQSSHRICFFIIVQLLFFEIAIGQPVWQLKGTVYDISQKNPVESVIVMSTGGSGVLTDTLGRYVIDVRQSDSIYFSYQGKVTGRYPVAKMENQTLFDMSIHVYIFALPEVTIRGRSYQADSIANRQEYAKYFGFTKPNPLKSINVGPTSVGMDPNEIINMFRFKRNRQLAELQKRLVKEEEDKYVDFRYNKGFVKRLTNLEGDSLVAFMAKYRPPYDFVVLTNELELGFYIQQCYKKENGELPKGVLLYQMGMH